MTIVTILIQDFVIFFRVEVKDTHIADIITDNFAEEELRTVGDRLPCSQRVNVLLSVFNLRWRDGENAP